jgi:hypothetical protein
MCEDGNRPSVLSLFSTKLSLGDRMLIVWHQSTRRLQSKKESKIGYGADENVLLFSSEDFVVPSSSCSMPCFTQSLAI